MQTKKISLYKILFFLTLFLLVIHLLQDKDAKLSAETELAMSNKLIADSATVATFRWFSQNLMRSYEVDSYV